MEDLGNILLNDDELNEEQLKQYLSGNISVDALHNIEKQMADSEFVNDAVEGLQAFSSSKNLDEYVTQLNKNLHQQLESKKQRKEKRKIRNESWIIIAVITILLLCVVAFIVIKMQRDKQENNSTPTNQMMYRYRENDHTFFV